MSPVHIPKNGKDEIERFVSAKEAASILRCHRNTVLRLVASGRIPAIRVGKVIRVQMSQVMAALAA